MTVFDQIATRIARETNKTWGSCWTWQPMRARPNKSPIPDGEAVTFTGQFSAVPSRETFAGRGQKGTRYVEGSTNKPRLVFIACDLPAPPKQEDVLTRVSDGSIWAVHEILPDHNGRIVLELSGPKGG